ncbi:hypothetical protein N7457_002845 [Penicillium paradoxum]|uniref:uncharacterized protein n=1 Tax=Penicillium paradoxum TaxID=176176 RepID=UPI0025482A80|nr:uncharacterized protein N7457_002845 [Penicillium paradoxum]KAJ5787855.1 hypothetical protein N7457_002845 [Penicillium paradoxum]
MGTVLDALSAPPLNVRRPAAPTLPSFELPPPPFTLGPSAPAPNKFVGQPAPPPISHPPVNVSVGNLLTPPATIQPGEHATPQPLAPSTGASDLPPTFWPGANPYGQSWGSGVNQYSARSSFSPSSGMQVRSTVTSPPTTDGLPHPFEAPTLSYQALPAPSTLPPSASQPAMTMYHGGPATSPAPLPSNDPYASKQHMYAASPSMQSPHQAGFSPMYGPAGLGIHPPSRMPVHSPSAGQPPLGYPRQPWPSYSLPAMNGPVMSNVHSPGGPMSMMGSMQPGLLPGFNSGHIASSQHLYGGHPPPHGMSAPAADRPFKCDQCPQSFNRNHDLKRHKRIHLAVKPFPCAHCDKSFSRKDALKRHILVKGCGKDGDSDAHSTQMGTDIKGEGRSEDGSPVLNGRV